MPRIREIRPVAVDIPLTEPFAIAGGAPSVARNVFVRVTLTDGAVGYGEAAPFEAVSGETQASTLAAIDRATPGLVGREATGWRTLRALMPVEPAARCGLEQALFAALAAALNMSVMSYFGGPPGPARLRTDITIPAGSVEHAEAAARRAASSGFDTVKVKAGAADWELDARRVRAIHAAEPGLAIIVDANRGWSLSDTQRFIRHIGYLTLLEQPTPHLEDLAALAGEVPICADESVRTPLDALRAAEIPNLAAINVKLMKSGVTDALDVIAVARSAGIPCMIGGMIETPLSMSFSAALAAAEPGLFRYIDLDTPLFMPPDAVPKSLQYDGPELEVNPGPPPSMQRWFEEQT